MLLFVQIAQSHTCQKWPAIESEWGMKVSATCSGACCACHKGLGPVRVWMHDTPALTHTHTHTPHTHPHHIYAYTIVYYTSSYPELYAICFYLIYTLSLSLSLSSHTHTHTPHTHVQTALSLACIDFKIIFFFHPSTRTLHQLQLGPRNQKIAPLQLLQGFQLVQ